MKFLKRFRHGLCKLAVLAVVCTLLIGILAVNALTKNSNYLLLDFTPGNTECDPDFWAYTNDLQALGTGNFDDSGRFRAIVKAGSDGLGNDPYVGMKIGGDHKLGYTVKSGDVIQINFRYRDLAYETDGRPSNAQIFMAGPETLDANGNVAYREGYAVSFVTDYSHSNYQVHTVSVNANMVGKVLDYIYKILSLGSGWEPHQGQNGDILYFPLFQEQCLL